MNLTPLNEFLFQVGLTLKLILDLVDLKGCNLLSVFILGSNFQLVDMVRIPLGKSSLASYTNKMTTSLLYNSWFLHVP